MRIKSFLENIEILTQRFCIFVVDNTTDKDLRIRNDKKSPMPPYEEEMKEPISDNQIEPTPSFPGTEEKTAPKDGFTFNGFNLFLGLALLFWFSKGSIITGDWTFYLYLAIAVIIHELGHVIMGKSFGCIIQEMQVFFLCIISYKPREATEGSSWKNIRWSLGALPLGGVTIFKSKASSGDEEIKSEEPENIEKSTDPIISPYIEDKPSWQRMLISAAGVLFNMATFFILYIALPHLPAEYRAAMGPLMSLSLILAVLNILPIYPLDGGAIVFSLYEMITGQKPSDSFTRACSWIGFIIIILFFWVFPEWLDGLLSSVFGLFF